MTVFFLFTLRVKSIGGNIMTASPISDLNPVFMAARCTLLLASAGGILVIFSICDTFIIYSSYFKTVADLGHIHTFFYIHFLFCFQIKKLQLKHARGWLS